MAEEPSLPGRTFALIVGDPVDADTAVQAGLLGAIVHVHVAVPARVAVDADAGVSVLGVGAGRPVLANVGEDGALVHVQGAVLARELRRAVAGVGVDAVQAAAAILAEVVVAVVNVDVTTVAGKTWKERKKRGEIKYGRKSNSRKDERFVCASTK